MISTSIKKSRDGGKKAIKTKSGSDGKLIQGDIQYYIIIKLSR